MPPKSEQSWKLNNVLLWVNGKEQNETMLCKANYGLVSAGAAVGAEIDATNAYIIVRRRDCELKRPNMFKKTLLER